MVWCVIILIQIFPQQNNFLIDYINQDVLLVQVRPEVAHAEARDNGAHEGEAVQVRAVQLPDGHALHPQQARLRHPQGRKGIPVSGQKEIAMGTCYKVTV